jgi:hypothetical protein
VTQENDSITRDLASDPYTNLQPTGWDEFRNWVLEMENHYERTIALTTPRYRNPTPSAQQPAKSKTPAFVGSTPPIPENRKGKLTPELRLLLAAEKRCFFCRQVAHDMSGCPRLPRKNVGPSSSPKPNVSVTVPVSKIKPNDEDSDSENVNTFSDVAPKVSDSPHIGVINKDSNTLPLPEQKATTEDEKVCVSTVQRKNHSHLMIPVTIKQNGKEIVAQAMIDSRATGNFVNTAFVKKHKIQKNVLETPISLSVVDGRPIASGKILNNVFVSI